VSVSFGAHQRNSTDSYVLSKADSGPDSSASAMSSDNRIGKSPRMVHFLYRNG
jgi:hypothetical protein